MSKQMIPIAALIAMGLSLPIVAQAANATPATLGFNAADATSASAVTGLGGPQDLSLNNPFSNWGITFHALGGGALGSGRLFLFNDAIRPSNEVAASGAGTSSDGFIGGTNFEIWFGSAFHFDMLSIRYAKKLVNPPSGATITVFDSAGTALYPVVVEPSISPTNTAPQAWTGPVDIVGLDFNGTPTEDIVKIAVSGSLYVDSIHFDCTGADVGVNTINACNIPNGQAGGGTTPSAPEPSSYGLVALGLLGAGLARRSRAAR